MKQAPCPTPQPILALRGIGRRFHGVAALGEVSLNFEAGRIHALVGENGAGKSTLINVCTGLLRPDEGELLLDGEPIHLNSPVAAARRGIIAVHQEADLFAELSLAENMLLSRGLVRRRGFLGRLGMIDWPRTYATAEAELAELGERAAVRSPARALSIGRRVLAEIAAAVAREARVLFLDEPTASLTRAESLRLFEHLRRLRAGGVAIVYVSHRLEEILALSDTTSVLRDGRHVLTAPTGELNMERLVRAMVGRAAVGFARADNGKPSSRPSQSPDSLALELDEVSDPESGAFRNVHLALRRGEVVGLYGLVGAGRTELARAVFGLAPLRGSVRINGRPYSPRDPAHAVASGLAYLPEDRLTESIFATHACRANVSAAALRALSPLGVIRGRGERALSRKVVDDFRVKLDTIEQPINTLSGGNQQKLIIGRWLATLPEVLIVDEPTRGVDVGAKVEIHRLIADLAARGKAVLMISSELPEAMALSDRLLVMREGAIAGEFNPRVATEDEIARAALPLETQAAAGEIAPPDRPESAAAFKPATAPTRRHDATLPAESTHPPDSPATNKTALSQRFREFGLIIALLLACAVLGIARPDEFATFRNLLDVLTAASIVSVAAAGMTLVIAAGGIDISIGSLLGLVGAIAGMAAMRGWPAAACLGVALLSGGLLGGLNSLLSTLGRIHPIIVTLAGISIYRGLMLQLTGGYEVSPLPDEFRALVDGNLWFAPKVLWIALFVLAANWLLLGHTLFGRRLLAVGNSPKAARQAGLSAWRLRLASFVLLGALVGLASVMWGGYYGKVQSNTGDGWELLVIAATVIGGVSISGGRGTALGAFLGAVLIALIYNGLVILQISAYWQKLFVGLLILVAVLIDQSLPRLLRRMKSP